jgi:hypothetical protein
MIHIVFQEADIAVLKEAINLDSTMEGTVVQIKDEFAVGPLQNIETEEGWEARVAWWRSLIEASPYSNQGLVGSFDDRETVKELKQILQQDENEIAWIWMGQNQHDVCGYYWLVSQMKEFHGRIYVLYLNNLPFINEKGQIFYPSTLHKILPKEFLKAKKLSRRITLSEFEVDPDEWTRLSQENAMVRILEGGKKIVGKEAGFYDQDILDNLSNEWQKGNKAMHQILSKMKIKTGDVFLLSRMRELAAQDRLELTGDPTKGWKEFEVKRKGPVAETITAENTENQL